MQVQHRVPTGIADLGVPGPGAIGQLDAKISSQHGPFLTPASQRRARDGRADGPAKRPVSPGRGTAALKIYEGRDSLPGGVLACPGSDLTTRVRLISAGFLEDGPPLKLRNWRQNGHPSPAGVAAGQLPGLLGRPQLSPGVFTASPQPEMVPGKQEVLAANRRPGRLADQCARAAAAPRRCKRVRPARGT